jgi:hypothetical protein
MNKLKIRIFNKNKVIVNRSILNRIKVQFLGLKQYIAFVP